jgi:hydroxymethylbilane synthase
MSTGPEPQSGRALRVGSRGSDLALAQARQVTRQLAAAGVTAEISIIRTAGDASSAGSFASIGPQGVFVREIEEALLERRIDFAVHSYKDLPTQSPAGLVIGAVPKRVDAADVLIAKAGAIETGAQAWPPLAAGALVGTSSARRQAWLRHFREDLRIEPLRGNVPTRLRKLREGTYDAIVLAAAGLERLRGVEGLLRPLLDGLTITRLDSERFVPAPSQGALAIQCRAEDESLRALLARLEHEPDRAAVTVEREALAQADAGCEIAFGAHCAALGPHLTLDCMLERQGRVRRVRVEGSDAATLGQDGWSRLVAAFGAAS